MTPTLAVGTPPAGSAGAADPGFSTLLPEAGAAPPVPPVLSPGMDEIARLRKDRDDCQAGRDAELRSRPRKLIGSITDRRIGKPGAEFPRLWDGPEAHGVAPDQLRREGQPLRLAGARPSARYGIGAAPRPV